MSSRHPRKRAFTLIEILVVITIIAILAGLFIPMINKSLERARRVACANNQHQIIMACMMYSQDKECGFPIADAGGGALPATITAGANAAQITARSMELLASIAGLQNGVFRCKSAGYEAPKLIALTDNRNGNNWGWGVQKIHYAYDWAAPMSSNGYRVVTADRCVKHHGDGAIVGCFDGSTRFIETEKGATAGGNICCDNSGVSTKEVIENVDAKGSDDQADLTTVDNIYDDFNDTPTPGDGLKPDGGSIRHGFVK